MRGHIRGRLRGSAAAAALWAHGAPAADVSLAIAPTNWVTCAPIATATFAAGLDAVVLEWAPGDAGAFTQIATCPDPSAESWTVELPGTVVGQPRRYRLTMTSGGLALYIDGSEGFNAFSGASLKKTTRTLAAGDHDIELIYRSVNTKKSFTFTWALEGVWDDRPVPMSQLKPAANSEMNLPDENATYDGWDFAPAIGSASYIPRFRRLGNGSFRMTGEKADYGAGPDMLALLTRGLDGPFTLTADFHTSSTVGRPSLFVSKSATSLYGNSLSYIYGNGQVGMKGGPGVADWGGVSWKSAGGSTRRLRVKRLRDKTITFSDMDVASGVWVTRLTMPQGVYDGWSLAADKLWVGISLFGNTSQRSDVTFTNLKLSLDNGTVIWLK